MTPQHQKDINNLNKTCCGWCCITWYHSVMQLVSMQWWWLVGLVISTNITSNHIIQMYTYAGISKNINHSLLIPYSLHFHQMLTCVSISLLTYPSLYTSLNRWMNQPVSQMLVLTSCSLHMYTWTWLTLGNSLTVTNMGCYDFYWCCLVMQPPRQSSFQLTWSNIQNMK